MAKAISTFDDVKRVVTEFLKKNPHLLDDNDKVIDTMLALKDKYDITSYTFAFGNDTEVIYRYEEKKIITRSGISKKKVRLYEAICLAYNIFAEANGEKPSSFLYMEGDPIYKTKKDNIVFDIATELLIADDNFKDIAMQYSLDIKQLAEFYKTTQAVVLNKLKLNELMF